MLHSYLKQRYAAMDHGPIPATRAGVGRRQLSLCPRAFAGVSDRIAPVEVIYNGVPDYGPSRPQGTARDASVMIGRICPEKGQKVFVEAARLVSSYPASSDLRDLRRDPIFRPATPKHTARKSEN